jgi:hypothetical protein
VQREQALTTLAEATAIGPITSGDAVARLGDRAIPATVLNELIQCNAVRMTGQSSSFSAKALPITCAPRLSPP